jgi:VanZ family protein
MPLLRRRSSAVFLALAATWMALVWYLSSLSDPFGLLDWLWGDEGNGPKTTSLIASLGHFGMFGVLALLLRWGVAGRGYALPAGLFAFVCTVGFGVIDELHQAFTPGRDPTWKDLVFDAAGAATALAISWLVERMAWPVESTQRPRGARRSTRS